MIRSRLVRRRFLLGTSLAVGAPLAAKAEYSGTALREPQPVTDPTFPSCGDFLLHAPQPWEVRVQDEFWAPKIARNTEITIPFEIAKLKATECGLNRGVLEAAMYTLRTSPNPALHRHVEERVRAMLARPVSAEDLNDFELSAAYFRSTGNTELLDRAMLVATLVRGQVKTQNPPYAGAERQALNCVQLYRVTHDEAHLALAKHYLDIRGRGDAVGRSRHTQSMQPVTKQFEAVGHAVNCATLMLSMVDVGVLSRHSDYFMAAHRMWYNAVSSKMYVTGGIGSSGNEGFGKPYRLPNISAYAETCAVLMFMTLNHRLHLATGDARYIDVMERGMYNNAIDGVSYTGEHFFYVNRLASAGDGRDERWQHASLECCPPNLVRFLASMPSLIYAQALDGAIHVNLFVSSEASFETAEGQLTLVMKSGMPWEGRSLIMISAAGPAKATIRIRIPGWARDDFAPGGLYHYASPQRGEVQIAMNGISVRTAPDRLGYVSLERDWQQGDAIDIEFPLEPRRVVANPQLVEDRRRHAVTLGPMVYCAEWPETPDGRALDLAMAPDAPLRALFDPGVFGGAVVVETEARHASDPAAETRALRLIPYHLWANRGSGEMQVWLLSDDYEIGDISSSGGIIFYKNPDAARDGWRYLEAAPFDQSMGAPWGRFRHELPGAGGTAIGTGRQNTADMALGGVEEASAAQICAAFTLSGIKGWFLPSRDELAEMYRILASRNTGAFHREGMLDNCEYWTSSQHTADMAGHIDFADAGRQHVDDKDFPRRVRAIRAF